ncbi:MAG: hypothetical protein ISR98_00335 [Parcubacteria group bacterium]|nr:hypothetical protein [Parcubacteria group bacterium]
MKNTILIIFVIILGLVAVVLFKGAESLPRPFDDKVIQGDTKVVDTQKQVFGCEPEQRNVDACIEIFKPVCAKINVQCVTSPCPPVQETFSNSCNACKNSLVDTYVEGECIVE